MGACVQVDGLVAETEVERSPEASAERRASVRVPAGDVPSIKGVRLKYGPSLSLVDVSAGGAQVESAVRLKPGSTLVVEIQGPDRDVTVTSRVVRCEVATVAPAVTYRGALAFAGALEMPGLTPSGAGLDARQELGRLTLAVKKLRTVRPDDAEDEAVETRQAGIAQVGRTAIGAAAMALAAVSASSDGAPVANELACLMRDVTRGIEERDPSEAVIERIGQRLWHWAGVRIGMYDASEVLTGSRDETIYFDLPAIGARPAARLVVQFGRGAKPTEVQFHLLKAAVQFVALARGLDSPPNVVGPKDAADAPKEPAQGGGDKSDAEAAPAEVESPFGLCRVVVRYADGRMLKGWTSDFFSAKRHFHLVPGPEPSGGSAVTVLVGQVKAVFFVRDFDGNCERVEGKTFEHRAAGRRVAVTFVDDEVLVGTTLNYRPDGIGFFVMPADPRSNNLRIFVVSQAVRHVQFL